MKRSLDAAAKMLGVSPNPCIGVYGHGPEGVTCKTCDRLICAERGRRYYKCEMRRVSRSAATDHRISWPACGKYVPGKDVTR